MRLVFRDAVPSDWPAIVALHEDQKQAQGSHYELPYFFGPIFPAAIVGVDEQGEIKTCFYVEAVCELRFVGRNPKATAQAQRQADGLSYLLKCKGFRWLECFIPRSLAKSIGKPLRRAKFECVDKALSHFTRDLRS